MSAKVFIASTCFDLIDVRSELEKDIRDMGLTPVLSDNKLSDFDYSDKAVGTNSIDLCRLNLKSCQYVIFIWSQRYGRTLEKYDYPDISATHLEYLTAVEHNKETKDESKKLKIIVYVRDRTIADYDRWRKKNDMPEELILYVKDRQLFKLIDLHASIHAEEKDRTNYLTEFASSVDLKQALRKQLDREANQEELMRLIRTGIAIPTFVVKNYNISIDGDKYKKRLRKGNNYLAIDVELLDSGYPPYYIATGCSHNFKICYRIVGEKMTENYTAPDYDFEKYEATKASRRFQVLLVDAAKVIQPGTEVELQFGITYTIANGYELTDHFEVFVDWKVESNEVEYITISRGKKLYSKGRIYEPKRDEQGKLIKPPPVSSPAG